MCHFRRPTSLTSTRFDKWAALSARAETRIVSLPVGSQLECSHKHVVSEQTCTAARPFSCVLSVQSDPPSLVTVTQINCQPQLSSRLPTVRSHFFFTFFFQLKCLLKTQPWHHRKSTDLVLLRFTDLVPAVPSSTFSVFCVSHVVCSRPTGWGVVTDRENTSGSISAHSSND